MEKGATVIPDEECEDLGDLSDFDFETMTSEDFINPLDFAPQNASQKPVSKIEQKKTIDTIEIDDSSQEEEEEEEEEGEIEDLGSLEDDSLNQTTSPILDDDEDNNDCSQLYSEATSINNNTTIPDYSQLTIKELQVSIARYGYKNMKSREKMVSILENIRRSENLQTPQVTSTNDNNNNEEKRMIIQHIKSQENVWKKILRYETVDVDEVYHGLTCKKSSVKAVLDEFAALKKRHPRLNTNAV
ncbi:hypothetical protein K501DRAFT_334831 [Backusella circina FSU 941]|nr:hypothetical protein K501DRAFT_334831 [Backusella circina FSU 941]